MEDKHKLMVDIVFMHMDKPITEKKRQGYTYTVGQHIKGIPFPVMGEEVLQHFHE